MVSSLVWSYPIAYEILSAEALRPQAHMALELFEERAQDKLHGDQVHSDDELVSDGGVVPVQRVGYAVVGRAVAGDVDLEGSAQAGAPDVGEAEDLD